MVSGPCLQAFAVRILRLLCHILALLLHTVGPLDQEICMDQEICRGRWICPCSFKSIWSVQSNASSPTVNILLTMDDGGRNATRHTDRMRKWARIRLTPRATSAWGTSAHAFCGSSWGLRRISEDWKFVCGPPSFPAPSPCISCCSSLYLCIYICLHTTYIICL